MNDIVLWYDDFQKNNCFFEGAVASSKLILKDLKNNNINFQIKNTTEKIDILKTNVYVIELVNVHLKIDIFSKIPLHTKKLFSEGLSILIYYSREGHELGPWFLDIYNNLKKNNLLDANIFFAFGDYDFVENYKSFIKEHKIKNFLTPIYVNFFAGCYLDNIKLSNLCIDENKKYDYLFYNRKLRPHRLYAVAELKNLNILKNGLVSLIGVDDQFTLSECINVLEKHGLGSTNLMNFTTDLKPIILDEVPDNYTMELPQDNNLLHYKQTFFSVVSETSLVCRFFTEKIYRPIFNLHPFIIIGPAKFLELLKGQGYKTFEELFDESYDNELDHIVRIKKVIKEIEKFVKISHEDKKAKFIQITDKLLYNKEHYINTTKVQKRTEFLKIFDIISNKNNDRPILLCNKY